MTPGSIKQQECLELEKEAGRREPPRYLDCGFSASGRGLLSLLVFIANMTQPKVTWGEEISVEELLQLDWSVGHFLNAGGPSPLRVTSSLGKWVLAV